MKPIRIFASKSSMRFLTQSDSEACAQYGRPRAQSFIR
jgi:hypothetical protein